MPRQESLLESGGVGGGVRISALLQRLERIAGFLFFCLCNREISLSVSTFVTQKKRSDRDSFFLNDALTLPQTGGTPFPPPPKKIQLGASMKLNVESKEGVRFSGFS